MIIDSFSGEYAFLSNFYPATITYDGILYYTNEHAFQASKTFNLVERLVISHLETPGKAKKAGRELTLRSDWEDVKYNVMMEICSIKFAFYSDLRRKLLETNDAVLIEGNNWSDVCWGVCNGVGTNWLGEILMEIRSKFQ